MVFVKEVLTFIGADAPKSNLLLSVMGPPPMVRPYKPQLANLRSVNLFFQRSNIGSDGCRLVGSHPGYSPAMWRSHARRALGEQIGDLLLG